MLHLSQQGRINADTANQYPYKNKALTITVQYIFLSSREKQEAKSLASVSVLFLSFKNLLMNRKSVSNLTCRKLGLVEMPLSHYKLPKKRRNMFVSHQFFSYLLIRRVLNDDVPEGNIVTVSIEHLFSIFKIIIFNSLDRRGESKL